MTLRKSCSSYLSLPIYAFVWDKWAGILRVKESGAVIETLNYGVGMMQFYRSLRALRRKFSVTTVHIIFFDYFSPVSWLARLAGMHDILYEMQNSGVFTATSWKRKLLQLRTKVATLPMSQIVT